MIQSDVVLWFVRIVCTVMCSAILAPICGAQTSEPPPGRRVVPIMVTVTPASTAIQAGQTAQFVAAVAGTGNQGVTWSLTPGVGSISVNGLYTAPATVSAPTTIAVTARSLFDSTKTITATVVVNPNVGLMVTPASATIRAGQGLQLSAAVSGSTNQSVVWSLVSGVGSISATGLYTAPSVVSGPTAVTVKATSLADGTKSAVSALTVDPDVTVAVTPGTGTVVAGGTVQLTAAVTGSANTGVTWSLSPAVGSISQNGLYTAPATVSAASAVTVTATSVADGTKKGSSVVTVNPGVAVSVTPGTGTVTAGGTVQLTAVVAGAVNTGVTWSLSPAIGTISSSGNSASYGAPAIVNQSGTVEVTATSTADPMKFSKAILTLLPLVSLSVLPPSATVKAGKSQQFSTSITGVTGVTPTINWTIEPAGFGTITSAGLYTAPAQVAFAQRVKVKASTTNSPLLLSSSDVDVIPEAELTFTLNNNGLDTVIYKGVDYNLKYGEGLVARVMYGEPRTQYTPTCTRALTNGVIEHNCVAGQHNFRVTARIFLSAPSTLTVDLAVTNQSTIETIREVHYAIFGIQIAQYDSTASNTGQVNSDNPLGVVNFVQGRYSYWLDTPSSKESMYSFCGTVCKNYTRSTEVAPGETRSIRVSAKYTDNMTGSPVDIAPEAYTAYAKAFPMSVQWPDRRPIMAWWIAEGSKRSAINPRGYFQNPLLNVSDGATFRSVAMAQATQIRDLMKARPVQPQGLIVWDLEGQEFIHPTTYIGDPRVFSSGYAAEMNAVVDDIFKTFRDAGYRVGVTVRPQFLQWGTQLPASCTYDDNHDFKSYYIKVDNPYGQRFHACYDSAGVNWSVIPESNGGQTIYKPTQIHEVTELLKSKIAYAYNRWGATIFYIDSAVWSGGRPLEASILRELQQTFPDILLIPEQESLETMAAAIPYSDSRIPDAKFAPISWRWAFPTGAFAVAIGDCQGSCWENNFSSFQIGQKIGDIAIYAQPGQMNMAHLPVIESMIQRARQEASIVTVTDAATLNVFEFRGDVTSRKPYPVKLRVYFGASEADMAGSQVYCEAGQWLGENSCTLNLDGTSVSEIRYYDFTNQLVYRALPTRFR